MFYGNHNHDASEQLSTQVTACISSRESSKLKWHADADADARWCCDSQTVLALKPSSTKGYRVQEGMGKCVVERFSNFHQAKPDSALSFQGSG
jgi:hypothetical protein